MQEASADSDIQQWPVENTNVYWDKVYIFSFWSMEKMKIRKGKVRSVEQQEHECVLIWPIVD